PQDGDDAPTRVATNAPIAMPSVGASSTESSATLPGSSLADGIALKRVGRYQIHERLGRGGMATVFKAHDPSIGRDVAIKFLHASLCEEPEYRSRFLSEARAAGGLSHPNIVTVHDVGEIDGRPYMAMELLDGQTLGDDLAHNPPQRVREVVVMGIQLARALDYAHARGIVHRDIKPGNIMRVKGTQTVKVTDFGIAHIESSGAEQRTHLGDILGTPQYMSPEQAKGERLDGRSDLFSAGIVLYQMLTGQRPFQGDSLVSLAMQIATAEPKPIEQLRTDVPAALRRIVSRTLAKLPERRYASGKELAEALTKVLAEIDTADLEKSRQRIVPLRVKWAATMGLIVAVVMALTATVINQRQYAAMISQATDYGASLARFIAAQNAVPALSEDWVAVEVTLQEMMKARDLQSISVIDREGIVRATSTGTVGTAYSAPTSEALGERKGGVAVTRFMADGESVLGFEAPITFQGKRVGSVALGLPEQPLLSVARLSIGLMVVLVVVTVLAVAVAMYFVANWFAQPIKLLGESMQEIAKGRFDHRISEQRNDEFGLLYANFDQMAQALADRQTGAGGGSALPGGAGATVIDSNPAPEVHRAAV
ncbi:MAG: protein kinase, partial [Pseudomonadota bacterium]|nr:protein kinase [Pseudomonadota bacterium]